MPFGRVFSIPHLPVLGSVFSRASQSRIRVLAWSKCMQRREQSHMKDFYVSLMIISSVIDRNNKNKCQTLINAVLYSKVYAKSNEVLDYQLMC